jgi:hypothetical protein
MAVMSTGQTTAPAGDDVAKWSEEVVDDEFLHSRHG